MKRYFTWFILYSKRLLKKPSFLILLLLLPLCTIALTKLSKEADSAIQVGIYLDLQEADDLAKSAYHILLEDKSLVHFHAYDSTEEMIHDIKTKKLDCGYFFPSQLEKALQNNGSEETIIVYSPRDSLSSKMVNEKVYSAIIQDYSFVILEDFVSREKIFSHMDDSILHKKLLSGYELYRSNGSTFTFDYGIADTPQSDTQTLDTSSPLDYLTLPIRGMLAVLILIAGFCGGLLWYTDNKNGIYQQVSGSLSYFLTFITIWIPTLFTGIISLICIYLCGLNCGFGWEIFGMLFYCLLVTGFCSLLRILIPTEIMYACALPLFALISLIVCPVFSDFSIYIPVFKLLRQLLPSYHYLICQNDLSQLIGMGIAGMCLIGLSFFIAQSRQRINFSRIWQKKRN